MGNFPSAGTGTQPGGRAGQIGVRLRCRPQLVLLDEAQLPQGANVGTPAAFSVLVEQVHSCE